MLTLLVNTITRSDGVESLLEVNKRRGSMDVGAGSAGAVYSLFLNRLVDVI